MQVCYNGVTDPGVLEIDSTAPQMSTPPKEESRRGV
jgi:hypothetical protein